jgi:hypothetical protein
MWEPYERVGILAREIPRARAGLAFPGVEGSGASGEVALARFVLWA